MKPGRELLKWLLLCVVALLMMSITLAGCGQGETTPSQEAAGGTTPSEEAAGGTTPSEEAAGGTTPSEEAAGGTTPSVETAGGTTPSVEVAEEATPSVEVVEETAPSQEVAKIGEEASDGQAAVTVHSVKFYDQITGGLGSTYKPSKEGDVFAIVDLSIRNVSGFTLEVGSKYVFLLDNQNKGCSRPMLIFAGWPYELRKLATKDELRPGEETRGMVVFTAESGTILDKVSYIVARPPIEFSLEELEKAIPDEQVEISDGHAAVTVHSVEFYDQITDGEGNTHNPIREEYVFVIVDLSIRNVSGSALEVGPRYVALFNNEDWRFSRAMLMIRGWPYGIEELDSEELQPEEETRGLVIFTAEEETVSKVSYTTSKSTIEISAEDLEVSIPPYRMPRIGETASGGGIEMRVSSIGSIEKLEKEYGEDAEYFSLIWTETAKEGQELVVLDLSIKNVFIEPDITINPLYVLLIDIESNAYGKVVLTLALEDLLGLTDLSPGEETWGRLLFSVPSGTMLDRVMYKIGALGPPVQVSLR